jgi:competence protein ComEC
MESKKKLLLISILIIAGLGLIFVVQALRFGKLGSFGSGKLRIIFCDVGQGDGMLIITPSGKEAVVDGGPGNSILSCLSNNMPFWDRNVEFMISTHPQADHMEGLIAILQNYQVKNILTTGIENNSTQFFGVWKKEIATEGAKIIAPNIGDEIILDSAAGNVVSFTVLWPGQSQINQWKVKPAGDLNDTAIIMRLNYGDFCVYLTADSPKEILERVVDKNCPVLKVAHHGSKTGTSEPVLDKIAPQLAVIQVGKNNRYGHPKKEVIDMLDGRKIKTLRNDINGMVKVDTDGKSFSIKTER